MGSRFDKPYRFLSPLHGNKEPLPGDIVWQEDVSALDELLQKRATRLRSPLLAGNPNFGPEGGGCANRSRARTYFSSESMWTARSTMTLFERA
jgi:hypothetical protein